MKVSTVACLLLTANQIAPAVNAASIPSTDIAKREPVSSIWERASNALFERDSLDFVTLEKRRGGGGGGGRSGGSSSSSSSSSGGSTSSGGTTGGTTSGGTTSSGSTGSTSSSGSTGSRSGSTSSTSNLGGSTRAGSGSYRGYGGGNTYAGGASTPFSSGTRSRSGITPFILPLAALSIFSGLWLYSVYSYPFHNPYNYYNRTLNRNQSLPVICLCQEYSVCGCDEEANTTTTSYYDALVALKQDNTSRLADVNGTFSLVINGTLENGTTAPGGTDDSGAAQTMMENFGWCWMMGIVAYTAFAM